MMDRRNLLICAGLGMLSTSLPLLAQSKVVRIGFLATRSRSTPTNPDPYYDAFLDGMRDLGYVEGRNLHIEWRFADGRNERLPQLAAELVGSRVELIVTHGTPAIQALQKATKTIPIVMATVIDPVRSGFVASLARPGGNTTGMSDMAIDLGGKQIELLRLMIPKLTQVAVLLNPDNAAHPAILKSIQTAAQSVGIEVLSVHAAAAAEIERGFEIASRKKAGAIMIPPDAVYTFHRRKFAELILKNRLASISRFREDVAAGGLMSYGQNIADQHRLAATYVDKILKGAKPGELPIEQPTKIHLAINRKTAKALGLRIPQELIGRADEIID